ncbi:protein of unknown function (plasmid) [Cupriavidus taiwanensis]|uniref:Uncharacterized protein n=1 Tax=Cupriavidus taiwanensis TaxID=164546 RepID=A0A375ISL3_9BURK|nr:protein of unknown function [Cupriavidus taiwanensis]
MQIWLPSLSELSGKHAEEASSDGGENDETAPPGVFPGRPPVPASVGGPERQLGPGQPGSPVHDAVLGHARGSWRRHEGQLRAGIRLCSR